MCSKLTILHGVSSELTNGWTTDSGGFFKVTLTANDPRHVTMHWTVGEVLLTFKNHTKHTQPWEQLFVVTSAKCEENTLGNHLQSHLEDVARIRKLTCVRHRVTAEPSRSLTDRQPPPGGQHSNHTFRPLPATCAAVHM